jgi:very-short-patch-repair endonuclease
MQRTSEQTKFARRLRRTQTYSERVLWILLRSRELARFKFRRQHPIGHYFANFACVARKLIVECDGLTHVGREKYDAMRDAFLQTQGYRVLRFTDDEVQGNPDRAAAKILKEICV